VLDQELDRVLLGAALAALEANVEAHDRGLWQEWQQSARGIHHALTGISQLTAQAASNYSDTEQAIASSFSQ
jgi:uncharacterized protein YukE